MDGDEKPTDTVLASSEETNVPTDTEKTADKMAPGLRTWVVENSDTDRPRTAIARPAYSADIDQAVHELEECGAVVESAGAGAITIQADAAALELVAELEWLVALEEPRRMELKLPSLSPDN